MRRCVHELHTVTAKVRDLVGRGARPTVCFDHGGWSPKLFAELTAAGFDILSFRKPFADAEPANAFHRHVFTDASRRDHEYLLADRDVRLGTTAAGNDSPAARSPASTRAPARRPTS